MFGFLKNLIRKPAAAPAQETDPAQADEQSPAYDYDGQEAEAPPAPPPRARPGAARQNGRSGVPTPQAQRAASQAGGNYAAQGQGQASSQGRSVQIPLQPILDGLPLEIQPRVVERNVGDL